MDDLTYALRLLCQRNRHDSKNSVATQADRLRTLVTISRQLREMGFTHLRANSLKSKHVDALFMRWEEEGLSTGTLKNRATHLRWWAEKVGKAGVIPADNVHLGIPGQHFVTNDGKTPDALEHVRDPHVRMSLALQQVFGLQGEESIKFQPSYADRGDCIVLKGSWTMGGHSRTVPITTHEQRVVLDQAHQLAGVGSLIPAQRTYMQQRRVYDGLCKTAGLSPMHGLRHYYAQARCEALTGWKAPNAGGPSTRTFTPAQLDQDAMARKTISHELGHERIQITTVYLGQ